MLTNEQIDAYRKSYAEIYGTKKKLTNEQIDSYREDATATKRKLFDGLSTLDSEITAKEQKLSDAQKYTAVVSAIDRNAGILELTGKGYSQSEAAEVIDRNASIVSALESELTDLKDKYNRMATSLTGSSYAAAENTLGSYLQKAKEKYGADFEDYYDTYSQAGATLPGELNFAATDPTYQAINRVGDFADLTDAKYQFKVGGYDGTIALDMTGDTILAMTEAEKRMYTFLYNTEGREAAEGFLSDAVKPRVNENRVQRTYEWSKKMAAESPIKAALVSIGTNAMSTMEFPVKLITQMTGKYEDNYSSYDMLSTITSTIRSEQADDFFLGEIPYYALMSFADSMVLRLPSSILSGVAGAGLSAAGVSVGFDILSNSITAALMASSASSAAITDAHSRGADQTETTLYALAIFATEFIGEKISWDVIMGTSPTKLGKLLKSSATGFAEESTVALVSELVDIAITRDKSSFMQSVNAKLESGMSRDEAYKGAFAETIISVGKEGLAGALTNLALTTPYLQTQPHIAYSSVPLSLKTDLEGARQWAGEQVSEHTFQTKKKQMVTVSGVDSALQKANSATEIAAIAAIPDVLKNGTVVSEGKSSKTISAVVSANGDATMVKLMISKEADGTFALDGMQLKQYSGNRVDNSCFYFGKLANANADAVQPGDVSLASEAETGYTGDRGEDDVILLNAGNDGSNPSRRGEKGADGGAEERNIRVYDEISVAFERRAQGMASEDGKRKSVLVRRGADKLLAYVPSDKSSPRLRPVADFWRQHGWNVVLTEGTIETNSNGKTVEHPEAMTDHLQKTIYLSETSKLDLVEVAVHEVTHMHNQSDAYFDFEAVVIGNLDLQSERYIEFLSEYIERYCIEERLSDKDPKRQITELDFVNAFHRELPAIVNGKIAANFANATEFFGGMFADWNAVVEASQNFNAAIGADYSSIMDESLPSGDGTGRDSYTQNAETPISEQERQRRIQEIQNGDFSGIRRFAGLPETQQNPQQAAVGVDSRAQNSGVQPMEIPTVTEDPSLTKAQRREKIQTDVRDSARQFGISEDVANSVAYIAGRTGTHILFVERVTMPDGSLAAGKFIPEQNLLLISKDADAPVYEVVKHELTHSIAGTELYGKLVDFVKNSPQIKRVLEANGIQFEQLVEAKMAEYAARGEQLDYDGAVEEIVADYVAKYLLTDQASITELFKAQQNVFYKFLFNLRNWAKNVRAPKDQRLLQQAEQLYVKALAQKGKRYYKSKYDVDSENPISAKAKHWIGYTTGNKPVVIIDENVLEGIPQNEWIDKVKEVIKKRFSNGVPVSGRLILVNKTTRDEYTHSKNTQYYQAKDGTVYEDKLRAAGNLDEIILASTNYVNEDLNHKRKDNFAQFARGDILLRVGTNDYTAKVIVGFTSGNNMVLYDVVDFVPTKITIKETDMRSPPKHKFMQNSSNISVSDTTVPQSETGVNTQSMPNGEKYSVGTDEDFEAQLSRLVQQYGRHDTGMSPERDVAIPKSITGEDHVSQTARTIAESKSAMPDEMLEEFNKNLLNEAMSYTPKTNRGELSFANSKLDELGYDGALDYWRSKQQDDASAGGNVKALGAVLLHEAARRSDTRAVMELSVGLCVDSTNAAQALQASTLIKSATPEGKAYALQKMVDRLNAQNSKKNRSEKDSKEIEGVQRRIREAQKRGAHQSVIEALYKELNAIDGSLYLPEAVVQNLLAQTTPEGAEQAFNDALVTIAQQKPATWLQKWNQWRYMAMLCNPRTHIRNISANTAFAPIVQIKDVFKFGLELMFQNQLENRTASLKNHILVEGRYRDFVEADYQKMADTIRGGDKYNPSDVIRDNQTIFKNKALEWLRKTNSGLLEAEDAVSLRFHYTRALAQYLSSNDIDVENIDPEVLGKAREYAKREAQKATFRDESAIADLLQRVSQSSTAANVLVEGVVPFKKTPVNITRRAMDYTPIGFVEAAIDITKFKKGDPNITLNDVLDKVASGLTGTLLLGLGMVLKSVGVLRGPESDKEKENQWDSLQGEQGYSINIGDSSYTIDWLAPSALPLFVGAELYTALTQDGLSLGETLDAITNVTDPIVDLSMMQGIQNTIQSASYGGNILSIAGSAAMSYFSQAIPSAGGQIARVFDDTRRQNYVEEDSPFASLQYSAQQAAGKIPYLENQKKEYVNQWGETESTGNLVERIFENILSPGYYAKRRDSRVDDEITRLYEATGDSGVLPSTGIKSFSVTATGKEYILSAQESTSYQKKLGATSYNLLKKLTASDGYGKMNDEQRVAAVGKIYDYAKEYARQEIVKQRGDTYTMSASAEKINTVVSDDREIADYLLFAYWNGNLSADKDSNGKTINGSKKKNIIQAANEAGYTQKEINYYMQLLGYSTTSYY